MFSPLKIGSTVPGLRIRRLNDEEPRADGTFVLYWMTSYRRCGWNFALQRAADWCAHLDRPLLVFEGLRADYPWASQRTHAFLIDGMEDNGADLDAAGVAYWPWIEPDAGAGDGLIEALTARAAVVVTDDYPAFFLPRMLAAVAPRLPVPLEAVDANGLLPLRAAERVFPTAYGFRGFLQRNLDDHLLDAPAARPLAECPATRVAGDTGADRLATLGLDGLRERWPSIDPSDARDDLDALPVSGSVTATNDRGGSRSGRDRLAAFVEQRLDRYAEDRNDLDDEATSGLSPWLHFGHLSSHEILAAIGAREEWSVDDVTDQTSGKRSGWWSMSASAEAYLDQLVTWRELGFNLCWQRDDYDRYESLPDWAQKTLAEHAGDERPWRYGLEDFENAATHEPLWNAAQNQLRREGRIHNYLRMLWGKKILHWSESPLVALEIMIELNNRYALDGRDPNSWSGIFWCLGRYDRAWGPERPVFGKIRYMSAKNTRRKLRVDGYLERYT